MHLVFSWCVVHSILYNSHLMHNRTQAVFIQSVCLKKPYHPIHSTELLKAHQWYRSLGGATGVVWSGCANDMPWSARKVLKELKNGGDAIFAKLITEMLDTDFNFSN